MGRRLRGCRADTGPAGRCALAGIGAVHLEVLGQHLPQTLALGRDVRELLQRRERVLDFADPLHSFGVLDEVLLRLGDEALGRVELRQLQVGRLPRRRVAQHLVAHRDGVVVKTQLGVFVDRLVVIIGGLAGILELDEQVANAVVNREVGVRLPFGLLVKRLEPDLDRLLRILSLETLGFFFELLEFRHGSTKISGPSEADKPNLLSRRRLRRWLPSNTLSPASRPRPPRQGRPRTRARFDHGRQPARARRRH